MRRANIRGTWATVWTMADVVFWILGQANARQLGHRPDPVDPGPISAVALCVCSICSVCLEMMTMIRLLTTTTTMMSDWRRKTTRRWHRQSFLIDHSC